MSSTTRPARFGIVASRFNHFIVDHLVGLIEKKAAEIEAAKAAAATEAERHQVAAE